MSKFNAKIHTAFEQENWNTIITLGRPLDC